MRREDRVARPLSCQPQATAGGDAAKSGVVRARLLPSDCGRDMRRTALARDAAREKRRDALVERDMAQPFVGSWQRIGSQDSSLFSPKLYLDRYTRLICPLFDTLERILPIGIKRH